MNKQRHNEKWSRVLLWLGFVFVCAAILGYGTFGRHPHWLSAAPGMMSRWAIAFYGISFRLFGEGLSWFFVLILSVYLVRKIGWRWLPAAVAVYALSLGSELAGVVWGIPFGEYHYTQIMGATWWGHVPYVIPASWWMMALPAYAMATQRFPQQTWKILLLGALWLTLWDVSLDPAMSYLTTYWQWKHPSGFYGMPYQNWFGWYVTSFILMCALHLLRIQDWLPQLDLSWLILFYALNLLVPFGMLVASGTWGAVWVNVLVISVCVYAWNPVPIHLKARWNQWQTK